LDIVLKIWAPVRALRPPLVSQAGYGPVFRTYEIQHA